MPERGRVMKATYWSVKSIPKITFYVQSFSVLLRHQSNCPPSVAAFIQQSLGGGEDRADLE